MLRIIKLLSVFIVILSAGANIRAAAQDQTTVETDLGTVICEPGGETYVSECVRSGPAQLVTALIDEGLPAYPEPALPVFSPDPALNSVPYSYFKVDHDGTALYPSLEAAVASSGTGRFLAPGLLFVSYQNRVDTGQGVYYLLRSGEWIEGAGSRISYTAFQGLELGTKPQSAFGWTLGETQVRRTPSYDNDNFSGETLYRYNIVPVYAVETVDDTDWVMIGPNKWIENRLIAIVTPKATPPEGVSTGRWIEVDLAEQTLAVYDQSRLVFATVISSGVDPYWTQPGLFQIYKKKETETMSGAFEADRSDYYYIEDVPYTMYFDKARALHGAYWRTLFGYPQSHGCVNLSVGDSHWLYDWAQEGDWVWVHDPSGLTPTDPQNYGDGGA